MHRWWGGVEQRAEAVPQPGIDEQAGDGIEAEDEPLVERRIVEDRMLLPEVGEVWKRVIYLLWIVQEEAGSLSLVDSHGGYLIPSYVRRRRRGSLPGSGCQIVRRRP